VQKQAIQQAEEQKRGAQRRAEVLKFLQMVIPSELFFRSLCYVPCLSSPLQRRDNPRRNSAILPALADVHAVVPMRTGGGGKRARLGGAPALESILEGIPSLAEEDSSHLPPLQPQLDLSITSASDSPHIASAARAVVAPDGSAETWQVEAQQAAAQ
jgi:hypothetical protein